MAWETPKTNWGQAGQTVPGTDDFNRIEGNILELQNTKETPAGAQAKADVVQTNLNFHANTAATISALGHIKHAVITATLDTSWSGSSAPYYKAIPVSGILASDTPIIDVVLSGDFDTDKARIEAWADIYRAVTTNETITFYAIAKPAVSLPIQIRVVR